ncbi:MAG: DUF4249 domain-containing protein [Phycisphaerae bacterium]|nr:DUF4249 domain-containing protein [Gemmatimonadaceae bacterium]
MKIPRVVLALAILPLVACERIVSIDLSEGPKRLVVEARLERVVGAGPTVQRIRLTTTDAYFSNRTPPPAIGATVQIVDETNAPRQFTELPAEPGVFVAQAFTPIAGIKYTLRVVWQGDRYEATERLLTVAPIDSLWFAKRMTDIGPDTGLRATISFRDPAATRNFYLWEQYVNGRRLLTPDTTWYLRVTASDDLLDGQRVRSAQPYGGIAVPSGAVVLVQQIAISEQAYRYYTAMSEQTVNNGSPFGVPPSNLRGNIANLTHPEKRALGYFMAGEVAEARKTVP